MKIQVTRNYDKFELLAFNRDVKRTTALERSMERYGWIDAYPMHVVPNGGVKLKIKAGHHRFTVAKKLGLPIKYVVCKDQGETIHELEVATTPWTLKNYLDSFVRCERPDYISVKEYHEKTGINLSQCISMLGGDLASSHNMGKKFKDGTYKVKEWGREWI